MTPEERRTINKTIWRHRRKRNRARMNEAVDATLFGAKKPERPKPSVVNWRRICGENDPKTKLEERFTDLYALTPEEQTRENGEKQLWVQRWLAVCDDPMTVPMQKVFTPKQMFERIRKLHLGKGSPDGCTAELFHGLPNAAVCSLAVFFTSIFLTLQIPLEWTQGKATLIPKVVAPSSLDKYRGIACLTAVRKLLGYLILAMLPDLVFFSVQCGFVPHRQAAEGVYRIKRILELCREWNRSVHVVQIDLSKAFDRVLHCSVLQALRLQSASLQCIAVVAAMLNQCELAVRLGHVMSDPIKLHRGLPQGAPESPLLFILVCEMVLRPLLLRWQTEGKGWFFCEYWLASLGYADDVLIFSENKDDVVKMLGELIDAFAQVGLDISVDKCAWSSYPPEKQGILNVNGFGLKWVKSLIFVGTVINFCGNDGEAILHRLAQAAKSLGTCRQILRSPRVALKRRLKLLISTVFASALWLSETWMPTKQQREHLTSWGSWMASGIAGFGSRLCHECCAILESSSSKRSQAPCWYGCHA